jgi:hypothetical protein
MTVKSVFLPACDQRNTAWGFEAEAERLFNKAVERRHRMLRAREEGRALSDSSETDDEEEWRGYEEVVVGSSDSDSSDEDTATAAAAAANEAAIRARAAARAAAMASELFERCDLDGSGELSVEEVKAHLTEVMLRDRNRRPSEQIFRRETSSSRQWQAEQAEQAELVVDGSVEAVGAPAVGDSSSGLAMRLGQLESVVVAQSAALGRIEMLLVQSQ